MLFLHSFIYILCVYIYIYLFICVVLYVYDYFHIFVSTECENKLQLQSHLPNSQDCLVNSICTWEQVTFIGKVNQHRRGTVKIEVDES